MRIGKKTHAKSQKVITIGRGDGAGSGGKYHNRKITYDGITFDSRKEAERYILLRSLERSGEIQELERQKKYVLIPAQRADTGRIIERECAYFADFTYRDKDGKRVVEDVKSEATRTKDYIIKRKLMLYVHHIRITEV